MRKTQFENNEFYHIYNRGVEKRIIFDNEKDYYRAIFQMYACNIGRPANIFRKEVINTAKDILQGRDPNEKLIFREYSPLVDILVFCLMPNHFHLILRQKVERGISKFMQKLGTAYTMYFNLRNKRSGSLFQGTFKAIHIKNENYLLHLSRYIHLNSVELIDPGWQIKGIKNREEVDNFLQNFQWSSYPDYTGFRCSKLINKDIFNYYFKFFNKKGIESYKDFLFSWLIKDLDSIRPLILE